MVVNKNGTTEQVTHYYPYGGLIGDISALLSDVTKGNNENVQKYKLFHYIPREQARSEGPRSHQKEIDNLLARRRAFRRGVELDRTFGLDYYDIHARQYFSMMPTWDRIDPLAEKYYGISPYAFCGGDPVNMGDYDGNHIYNFDESGNLINIYNTEELDKITITKNGTLIEGKEYRFGTIELIDKKEYTCFKITGDLAGTEIFEFMADNSANTLEWGQIITGDNSDGTNYVSSKREDSHQADGTKQSPNNLVIAYEVKDPTTLREINHSHPDGSDPSSADISFSEHWDRMSGKELKYNVYRPSYLDAGSERKAKYLPFTYRVDQLWVKILYNIEL